MSWQFVTYQTDDDKSFYTPVDKKFIGKDTGYVFVKYNF